MSLLNRNHPLGNPAAFWKPLSNNLGGGKLYDLSAYKNDGILNGGVTWGVGRLGNSLVFDGSSGYVSIPDSNSVHTLPNGTFSAWVNCTFVGAGTVRFLTIGWKGTSGNNNVATFFAYIHYNDINYILECGNGNGSTNIKSSYTIPTLSGWHHVALSWTLGGRQVYWDGQQVFSDSTALTPLVNNGAITIGNDTATDFWQGKIASASLWTQNLSQSQITWLYKEGLAGFPTLLLNHSATNHLFMVTTTFDNVGSGTTVVSGSVVLKSVEVATASGIIKLSGNANMPIFNYVGSGVCSISGKAIIESKYLVVGHGGCVCGGINISFIDNISLTNKHLHLTSGGGLFSFSINKPNVPYDLVANGTNTGEIDLAWFNGGNATSFEIDKATNGEFTQNFTTISVGLVSSYYDTSVTSGNTYFYKVRAINDMGSSYSSNVASASPSSIAPFPALTATNGQTQFITLSADINSSTNGMVVMQNTVVDLNGHTITFGTGAIQSKGPSLCSTGSGASWTNPANVASSSLNASVALGTNVTSGTLTATWNANVFSIPQNSVISGIAISYTATGPAGSSITMDLSLGATYFSNVRTASVSSTILGSSIDLWGNQYNPVGYLYGPTGPTFDYSVTNAAWNINITASTTNTSGTVTIGNVQATIYYYLCCSGIYVYGPGFDSYGAALATAAGVTAHGTGSITIKNGTIRQTGNAPRNVGIGVCPQTIPNGNTPDMLIDNVTIQVAGTDSSCYASNYGTTTRVQNCNFKLSASSSFNRSLIPANICCLNTQLLVQNNTIVGGNSCIKGAANSIVKRNILAPGSMAVDGFAVYCYEANNNIIMDNVIIPSGPGDSLVGSCRGIAIFQCSNNVIQNNVIMSMLGPTPEDGRSMRATCIMVRWGASNNMVENNINICIGGGNPWCEAGALYLLDTGVNNLFANNIFNAIAISTGTDASGEGLLMGVHGTNQGNGLGANPAVDLIRNNQIGSNSYILALEDLDIGGTDQSVPLLNNTFSFIDPLQTLQSFIKEARRLASEIGKPLTNEQINSLGAIAFEIPSISVSNKATVLAQYPTANRIITLLGTTLQNGAVLDLSTYGISATCATGTLQIGVGASNVEYYIECVGGIPTKVLV